MKELLEIIAAYDNAKRDGKKSALVTLVHVDGSSYRRPGARMLVTEDGELTGAISGGCLEGDALNKALLAIHQQKNSLVTYDTSDEEDAVLGLGLGCNGVIQVLIQPVDQSVEILRNITSDRKHHVLATLFSLQDRKGEQLGTCVYMDENNIEYLREINPTVKDALEGDLLAAFINQKSLFKNYKSADTDVTAYIEYVSPAVSLIIAGAGNDVDPVVSMAALLGWQVTLIDDGRDKNTRSDRFAATCRMVIKNPAEALQDINIDEYTFFLLMTHNYHYDISLLRELLQKRARYIGLLGPRKKLDRMINELEKSGMAIDNNMKQTIYSPVGLNIGAENPAEIALSMVAEIKSVLSSTNAQSLRNTNEVIHPRSKTFIETKHI